MPFDPKSIPENAELLDVEGVPVVLDWDNMTALAWDSDPPREFPPSPAIHNGAKLTMAEFEELIKNPY